LRNPIKEQKEFLFGVVWNILEDVYVGSSLKLLLSKYCIWILTYHFML